MKRLIALIMTLCLLLSFSSCAEERTDIDDYQYMYDGIFNQDRSIKGL